ncbi:2-dehydropantoate 2-reductase [Pseudoduganella sp. FT25W]|uniref:2-dehydropantoate 2-reductase n=1 Tax=Duganella alba TaxID=2666081 RepID=A0A6L5QHT5_9BURK|nr:2-dehydropantoate 2-reductase [Duganella alba]MRX09384.1 2-dehydropantoate 2-reductase [Duganella alba]MRX17719.1 2-dehydropantoate 2-reductase [Duganella alba]
MKFLVVGAGALGGYFGGRLLAAGQDVTFLVRAGRAAQLQQHGLRISSPKGDLTLPSPPHLLAEQISRHYDVIVVGCKAYDLDATMESFAAVGPDTAILPVLNGMAHLERLAARFGKERVLGGLCLISATLGEQGEVQHLNDAHALVFGELDAASSARVTAIESAMAGANFDARASDAIRQEMWEKWIFITSLAGATCLLRGSVGDIVAAGQADIPLALLNECSAIAASHGFPPREQPTERARTMLTAAGSPITASMLKDLERGGAIEADHIVGDMLARGQQQAAPTLQIAYAHLTTYEARRKREAK